MTNEQRISNDDVLTSYIHYHLLRKGSLMDTVNFIPGKLILRLLEITLIVHNLSSFTTF